MKFPKLERNDVMIRYMHVDFRFEEAQMEKKNLVMKCQRNLIPPKMRPYLVFINLCQL